MVISSDIKHFTVRLMLFLLLFFAVDRVGGEMMSLYYFSQSHKTTYALSQGKEDVVILGSSRALHHYIPEMITDSLGLSCFNYGDGGQNIYYHYAIIKGLLSRYTPKVIIMEQMYVDYNKTASSHDKDKLSIFMPDAITSDIAREMLLLRDSSFSIKSLSHCYLFNSQLASLVIQSFKNEDNINFNNQGFVPISTTTKQPFMPIPNEPNDVADYDISKLGYLEKAIELCKSKGVELIITASPLYYDKQGQSPIDTIGVIAARHNVAFYNFEQNICFTRDSTNFTDTYHLNNVGARRFTREIIKIMR